MLSYRHAFHAGNHADVLKHIVLLQVLEYMKQKETSFLYVDTHSGAGLYDLHSDWASKTSEYKTGISHLWQATDLPPELQLYIDMINQLNPEGELKVYPGSPWIAYQSLRPYDKARLFELHPNEYTCLNENFVRQRNIKMDQSDGFQALNAVLPPASRRAVVLIDPPYEVKSDYQTVVSALKQACHRFNSGVYMLWYPVVNRKVIEKLERSLVESGIRNIQLFELAVQADTQASGMTASGMIVINPPWKLQQTMQSIMPWLQQKLCSSKGCGYRINQLVDE